MDEPTIARFWSYVDKRGSCWLWMRGLSYQGYGKFWCGKSKRSWTASRFAWTITYGPIPPGIFICHKCDAPACVNPDHLFLGTQRENLADCIAKGRTAKGCRNAAAKINETIVRQIRASYVRCAPTPYAPNPFSTNGLAKRFGISQRTVWSIVHRKIWRHI